VTAGDSAERQSTCWTGERKCLPAVCESNSCGCFKKHMLHISHHVHIVKTREDLLQAVALVLQAVVVVIYIA